MKIANSVFFSGLLVAIFLSFAHSQAFAQAVQQATQVTGPVIKIQTQQGYASVPFSQIDSVDIEIAQWNYESSGISVERLIRRNSVKGPAVTTLLSAVAFNGPQELGAPGGIATGKILIHFAKTSGLKILDRTFEIQNNRIVLDTLYPTITYRPTMPLDETWLRK